MHIEDLRTYCLSLAGTTEDIKWEHDLCFSIRGKMYCVASLEAPFTFSFKATPENFASLTQQPGIKPAPYLARYHWVLVEETSLHALPEWERYILESYHLVKQKLPKKVLKELEL